MPVGICTVDRSASMPSSVVDLQGIPITGRVVFAAPAVYTADSPAFKVVCATIDKIKADFTLKQLCK